jgi:23S rRNA (uracil1939-C5)-methyltransferase
MPRVLLNVKSVPTMESVELLIKDVVYPGKGLARLASGCVVFVPGTLTGETVRAEVTRRKKNFAEARLVEVVKPSKQRRAPQCPIAAVCPGCRYQHADYTEELRLKQAQFVNLLEHQAGIDGAGVLLPPVPSPIILGYRSKIALHTGVAKGDAYSLGYFAEDNCTVIDVEACPLAMPELNNLLADLRKNQDFMKTLQPKMTVTLRYTKADGAVSWCRKARPDAPWLTESTAIGDIKVPRGGFFQINPAVAGELTQRLIALVGETKADAVIDLYCGTGVFALGAALSGIKEVVGVDSDEQAIRTAEANALERKLTSTRFIAAPALSGLKRAIRTMQPGKMAVIVDPPRIGLEKEVVAQLVAAKPADIIYVSCAPDTLARDIKLLVKGGYRVVSSQLLDMFPRTPYFESLTHLYRPSVPA